MKNKKAFTLKEVTIVIASLAIVAICGLTIVEKSETRIKNILNTGNAAVEKAKPKTELEAKSIFVSATGVEKLKELNNAYELTFVPGSDKNPPQFITSLRKRNGFLFYR